MPSKTDQPHGSWQWSQSWRDVLFAHHRVPAGSLRSILPAALEVDTFHGEAWTSLVAFDLCKVRLPYLPPIWPFSRMLELNFRTYVRYRGIPGIYFLSMHGSSRPSVHMAQLLTPLPYAFAKAKYDISTTQGRFAMADLFDASFQITGMPFPLEAKQLDHWLLERYTAFVPNQYGQIKRMDVAHQPWKVQSTTGRLTACTLGKPCGIPLSHAPNLWHFSSGVQAHLWPFRV